MEALTDRLRQYIEDRSIPIPEGKGCWLWLLSIGTHGYGQAWDGITVVTASSLSYRAFKGPIPKGHLAQHSCDERWCTNPDHLSLGTDRSNDEDKRRKGRGGHSTFGRPHPKRKLSDEAVAIIRADTVRSLNQMARDYGVSKRAILYVRKGVNYRVPS
jgi:hypothetical protein